MGFLVVTVRCYLGGFIGDQAAETEWLEYKLPGWTTSVEVVAGVACVHP